MNDNISPEEKLLRLIRGKKEQKVSSPHPEAVLDSPMPGKPSDINSSFKRLLFRSSLSHTFLQKALFLVILVSFIPLVISFVYPFVGLKKIKLPAVSSKKIEEFEPIPDQKMKPYEFYSQALSRSDLFKVSTPPQEVLAGTLTADASSIKDIDLVGIISGDSPQAIIEDKKIKKTYYVTKGQFIGDIQVEDILQGKVVLIFEGQRYELHI